MRGWVMQLCLFWGIPYKVGAHYSEHQISCLWSEYNCAYSLFERTYLSRPGRFAIWELEKNNFEFLNLGDLHSAPSHFVPNTSDVNCTCASCTSGLVLITDLKLVRKKSIFFQWIILELLPPYCVWRRLACKLEDKICRRGRMKAVDFDNSWRGCLGSGCMLGNHWVIQCCY